MGGKEKRTAGEMGEGWGTLPVDKVWVRDDPRLEHPFELAVALEGGQEMVVLMAAWDVYRNLPVSGVLRVLVNGSILSLDITLHVCAGIHSNTHVLLHHHTHTPSLPHTITPTHLHSQHCCPHLSPHKWADVSEGLRDDAISREWVALQQTRENDHAMKLQETIDADCIVL